MNSPVLYINGLGDGEWKQSERGAARRLERQGYSFEHAHLNWRSSEGFEAQLGDIIKKAEDIVREQGKLAIVGASAGGSMAVNVFKKLDSERVVAVNICGRLAEGDLAKWDWRKLEVMAHLGTSKASQSFYDSVKFCDTETVPSLTDQHKERLFIFHQLFDFVVPHSTMLIPGVQNKQLSVIGHGSGIYLATRRLPDILEILQ